MTARIATGNMKCLIVAMSAPREHEPNIELAGELTQKGIEPHFLTHLTRTARQLRAANLRAYSIGEVTRPNDGQDGTDGDVEAAYGLISLRELCFPESHLSSVPEAQLIRRARAYLDAASRFIKELAPSVVVQNSGAELLRRVAFFASREAGVEHLFLRPTPFKGRTTWSINSERGDWTILDRQAPPLLSSGEELVRAFRSQKTRIAKLNIPLPQSSHAKVLMTLLKTRYSETEPMGSWDPVLRAQRFAAATVRAGLQRILYTQPDYREPFVFFPVHVWHDSAITVRAPHFIRQHHLIHTIADALPQDWKLYVKEHPVSVGRNPLTATMSLARRENIRILPPELESHHLVERAKAVVVINSTAGFEALAYYKPVVVLGKPFYSGRGLTIDVDDLFQLRAAIKAADSFTPDQALVNEFFALAHSCTFPATQITPGGNLGGIAAAIHDYMATRTSLERIQLAAQ
jgi:hypothetical protein